MQNYDVSKSSIPLIQFFFVWFFVGFTMAERKVNVDIFVQSSLSFKKD